MDPDSEQELNIAYGIISLAWLLKQDRIIAIFVLSWEMWK